MAALQVASLPCRLLRAQQQGKVWRIGFLAPTPASLSSQNTDAFLQGMRELGYVEGKNLAIDWRFADGKYERSPGLAAELVQLKVDAIVVAGTPAASAAQEATATIPIVMANAGDPVGTGLIKSLARPGGNTTGLTNITDELGPKQLEMLQGMVPKLSRVAVLFNPGNSSNIAILKSIEAAAQRAGVKILPVEAQTQQQIENAFSMAVRSNAGAIIVAADLFFIQQQRQIAELTATNRLPSIAWFREFVEAGVLMTYGPSYADMYRRAAVFVDKILKGAKPGDLPVEQPTKFELFINRKTAKALGLTIPQSLMISADRVIE